MTTGRNFIHSKTNMNNSNHTYKITLWLIMFISLSGMISVLSAFQQEQRTFIQKDQQYLDSLNKRIDTLITTGKMDSVQIFIDEALLLADLLNDREGEATAYVHLGNYFLDRLMPDSVIVNLEEPYKRLYDTSAGLRMGNAIATAHARNNDPAFSLLIQEDLLERALREENRRMYAGITQNMGNNYSSLGDLESAIDHFLISLEMGEELADTSIMIVVLDNLGNLNRDAGNLELAENYISKALELAQIKGNVRNQLTSHLNLGIVYNRTGDYEQAEYHFKRVIEIGNQLGNVFSKVQALYNMGEMYANMGNYTQALETYEESLNMSRDLNIQMGMFYNQGGIASVYDELNDLERSIQYYENAVELAETFPSNEQLITVLKNLSDVYAKSGDITSAYSLLQRYSTLQDSLRQTEREEALAKQEVLLGLRTERETREITESALRKEQQGKFIITLLLIALSVILVGLIILIVNKLKANKLLEKRKEELSKANEDKDRLLSLLSHDLRTPISSLMGIVHLIRSNLINREELNRALDQIDANLQKEINTLTNYLQWAKNQKDGIKAKIEPINVTEISQKVVNESRKIAKNKGVLIENNLPESLIIDGDRLMISVILRNLVSNAVKYTKKGEKVSLDVIEKDTEISLSVKDNGLGIPTDKQNQIFEAFHMSYEGTNGEIGTGLGLSICKEFADKQNADIHFESEPGKGTTFYLTFRKNDTVLKDPS